MISQHKSANTMSGLEIRRLLGEETLNTSRSPRNELTQFALSNSQQTLVHLRWIDLAFKEYTKSIVYWFILDMIESKKLLYLVP